MRLFAAVLPDDEMRAALSVLQQSLKEQNVTGRYIDPEQLHVTLAFIGEYGSPQKVADALEEIVFEPFVIRAGGLAMFHDICVCTIEGEGLARLSAAVRRTLAAHDIPFDRKKFTAHVTLIRRAAFRKDNAYPEMEVPGYEMTVSGFSLMRSDRTKKGMSYTEVADIPADCFE